MEGGEKEMGGLVGGSFEGYWEVTYSFLLIKEPGEGELAWV